MRFWTRSRPRHPALYWSIVFAICLPGAAPAVGQAAGSNEGAAADRSAGKDAQAKDGAGQGAPPRGDPGSTASATTRLRILVTGNTDKPIGNASVYVRYNTSGGFLHHDKMAEMDLKTNQDGSVKVPEIAQGKIMIQVVAPGWHTYGKWYDVDKSEEIISIKLELPPHWY